MAIGTSLGAYFEDEFHHQAGIDTPPEVMKPKKDTGDDNVAPPDPESQGRSGDPKVLQVSDTSNASTMAVEASRKAADALKWGQGTPPTSDVDTGIEGKVYFKSPYATITDKDIDNTIPLALSFSGGGLEGSGTKVLQGVPRIGLKGANDNIAGLYNPREPSMIGSKTLDDAIDNSWKQMGEKHDSFIKAYDELHAFGNEMASTKGGYNEFNIAKYNRMGRDLNSDWVDIPKDPLGLKPEEVTRPALQYLGKTYEGQHHGDALTKILGDYDAAEMKDMKEGFSTSHGRFVSREEAFDIAKKQEQIRAEVLPALTKDSTMLLSEDLKPYEDGPLGPTNNHRY